MSDQSTEDFLELARLRVRKILRDQDLLDAAFGANQVMLPA